MHQARAGLATLLEDGPTAWPLQLKLGCLDDCCESVTFEDASSYYRLRQISASPLLRKDLSMQIVKS
jgi:hypothetical protein